MGRGRPVWGRTRGKRASSAPVHLCPADPRPRPAAPPRRRLVEDTAWHPVEPEKMAQWSPLERTLYTTFLGTPLKLWASVGHWWIWHFDLSK